MVRITKIYTKTGDDGTTGLVGGQRITKDAARVEAYGTVDEANAAIGVAIAHADAPLRGLLESIQHDLFDAGADLATPRCADEAPNQALRVTPAQTTRLEHAIDEHNERLEALSSFVLPGGSVLAAALHLARTITRRAERTAVTLARTEPDATNTEVVRYLNRLSDLLFVLARVANDHGTADVLWKPGANRGSV